MKTALLAAALLLAGGATACGGEPPADASEQEFCETYNSLFAEANTREDASDAQIIEEIKAWGKRLEETGTPANMSQEARAGFERSLAALAELDADATREDFAQLEKDYSEEERRELAAFDEYSAKTCGSPLDQLDAPQLD